MNRTTKLAITLLIFSSILISSLLLFNVRHSNRIIIDNEEELDWIQNCSMIGLWTSPFYTEDSESLFINLEEKGTFELHNWVGPEYIQKGNWNIINNPMMLRLTFFELDPYWSRDLSNPKLKELAPYIGEYSFDHKYIEFPISYASSENSRKAQCDLDKFNINLFNNLIYKNTL